MGGSAAGSILSFAAVAALLVLTPGVGTTYLATTVIANGERDGYLTAMGMVIGAATHATIAALGTAVLLSMFPGSLRWIAIVGGAGIVALGLRGVFRVFRPAPKRALPDARRGGRSSLATGILIALGNAPLPVFYLVVVPQYVPRGWGRLAGVALLSAIHLTMAGTWMATLVTLVGKLVDVLRRPRVLLTMQLATGLLLIFLGATSIRGAL